MFFKLDNKKNFSTIHNFFFWRTINNNQHLKAFKLIKLTIKLEKKKRKEKKTQKSMWP